MIATLSVSKDELARTSGVKTGTELLETQNKTLANDIAKLEKCLASTR